MYSAFAFLNARLRTWYGYVSPTGVSSDVPGDAPGAMVHVDEFHALVACLIFATALAFNLNAAAWSFHGSKYKLNLQVAYISAVAAHTHYEMWRGEDWYVTYGSASTASAVGGNVSFSGLRQLEWIFTTPVLLLLVQNMHAYATAALPRNAKETSTYVPVSRPRLIAADEAMIACGLVLPLTTGVARAGFLACSVGCFLYVIYHSVRALMDILRSAEMGKMDAARLLTIAGLKIVAWTGYPTIYFLTEWGFLSCKRQHDLYLYNDVLTKFTYSLVISAGSMRFIEALDDRRTAFAVHMSNIQRAFFFNITHELRTPLNSIIGFNTLAMESGELTEFTTSFIKASLTSAEALLGLINQILDFAKFEGAKDQSGGSSSTIELSKDVFTLRQLIEQVTDISQKASSRGVELVMHIDSPQHFNTKFVGDFFRLRQCCVNLVDNAIKYSSNVEGRTALVEFNVGVSEMHTDGGAVAVTFEIKDNGVGIPTEKQHALFVPFCQPADHKTAKTKGTGLGLVITKAIVECMGGEIDFESVEDKMTRFFFTVEFARARESMDENHDDDFEAEEGDFLEEGDAGSDADRLPPDARAVFHPSIGENTRRHLTTIFKCFGGRPGVNYVTVPSAEKLPGKVRQASQLGNAVILVDVGALEADLPALVRDYAGANSNVGVLIVGLPYQLMELHRNIDGDAVNVQTVLKPVKPSDFLRAMRKLTATSARRASLDANVMLFDTIGTVSSFSGDVQVEEKLRTADANARENVAAGAAASPAEGAGELTGMRVLLVEDNLMNQQMAKFSIIKCGAELEIANHGQEAVDAVTRVFESGKPNYDCVLMDMMMPVMDGATATRAIRALEREYGRVDRPHVIVGLSANVGPEYTAQVKAAGMDGSMSKPFYPATLRNTLSTVFQGTYAGFAQDHGEGNGRASNSQAKPGN